MTALISKPGSLIWRRPKRGDMDKILAADLPGASDIYAYVYTPPSLLNFPTDTTPGPDCPACPAARDEHDGWGSLSTGCKLSIAIITRRAR